MRKLYLSFALLMLGISVFGQELNFSIRVNTQKLQTVDPKVFSTLEQSLTEFFNNQNWTDDDYEPEERINGNITLTIQEELSSSSFKADLAIQTSRPVYGSTYETPLFNHLDKDVTFSYEQYQPVQYSRNSFNDNLSSVLSFYVYLVLGMDYDSFAPFGGEKNFQIAMEILNNVPQSVAAANPGWRSIENNKNRYWIIENLLTPRVRPYRQAMYDYHRQGLDIMYNNVNTGLAILENAINDVKKVDQAYPNSMIIQSFVNAKAQEIIEIFRGSPYATQNKIIQAMTKIDPAGASKYNKIRKG